MFRSFLWKRSLAPVRQECCVLLCSVLRAYMHGYFMDMRLYKKAQAVAQPFAYETYRQEQIDKKIDDEVRRAWRVFCFRLSLTSNRILHEKPSSLQFV